MANYVTNQYGYYDSMKEGNHQKKREEYAKGNHCNIKPSDLGEKLKEYYHRKGYM